MSLQFLLFFKIKDNAYTKLLNDEVIELKELRKKDKKELIICHEEIKNQLKMINLKQEKDIFKKDSLLNLEIQKVRREISKSNKIIKNISNE